MEQESMEKPKKRRWGILGGIGALFAVLSGKLKFLLPLLKLLKLGKIGGTIWSMLVMVGAYALIYPWWFAIGVVVMIFIHEMGHVLAAKRKKLPVSAPAFIPFVGALITLKKQPQDAATEAYVALGGPLLGSVGAVLCLGIGMASGNPLLYGIAWVGIFLNLINLLPIHPLDGGRIVTAISRWLWTVGLVGGLVVILYLKAFIFLFFWILFAWELFQTYVLKRHQKGVEERLQLRVPVRAFEENFMPVPGPEHTRRLSYRQYCRLEDQEMWLDVIYPGIGTIASIPFPLGVVRELALEGAERDNPEELTLHLRLRYQPKDEYRVIKDAAYYEVPARTRLYYGLAYFGLILILAGLLVFTAASMPTDVIGESAIHE